MNCWHCETAIEVGERVGFRNSCPGCDRAVHVCRNCGFFDPAYHNQCRETIAELVADKERANFCEFFVPGSAASPGPRAAIVGLRSSQPSARAKLEELFKRK